VPEGVAEGVALAGAPVDVAVAGGVAAASVADADGVAASVADGAAAEDEDAAVAVGTSADDEAVPVAEAEPVTADDAAEGVAFGSTELVALAVAVGAEGMDRVWTKLITVEDTLAASPGFALAYAAASSGVS